MELRAKPGEESRRNITPEQVATLAATGMTAQDIADVLDCDRATIFRHFGDAFSRGSRSLDASLRQKQAQMALKGNSSLLIWLGKVRLGQREPEQDQSTKAQAVTFELPSAEEHVQ